MFLYFWIFKFILVVVFLRFRLKVLRFRKVLKFGGEDLVWLVVIFLLFFKDLFMFLLWGLESLCFELVRIDFIFIVFVYLLVGILMFCEVLILRFWKFEEVKVSFCLGGDFCFYCWNERFWLFDFISFDEEFFDIFFFFIVVVFIIFIINFGRFGSFVLFE